MWRRIRQALELVWSMLMMITLMAIAALLTWLIYPKD